MVSGTGRKAAVVAGALAFAGGGAVIANAQQANDEPCLPGARGGLALCAPAQSDMAITVNRTARAGTTDKLFVINNSSTALDVTAAARPWTQSSSGVAVPNRRKTLGAVSVSDGSFTLAPGTRKELTVTLDGVPSSGYQYGALDVIGLPSDLSKRKGVVAGYRMVSALRYSPATAKPSIKPGAAKVVGSGSARALTLSVRNTGNTLDPVSAAVRLKSALGTRNSSVKAVRILPGKTVRLGLLSGRALRPGTYTAKVTLTQAKRKTTVTKKIRVRR